MNDELRTIPDNAAVEQFVMLSTTHQRRLFQYILTLVSNLQDAEDVLQETNLVLWRKFAEFERGTNFVAWASRVAHFEVLRYRKRAGYRQTNLLDEDLIEQLGGEVIDNVSYLDAVREALHGCLGRLRPEDRELVSKRYGLGASGKGLAETLGRPQNSVYKSLGRIRRSLLDCINRSLERDGPRRGTA